MENVEGELKINDKSQLPFFKNIILGSPSGPAPSIENLAVDNLTEGGERNYYYIRRKN